MSCQAAAGGAPGVPSTIRVGNYCSLVFGSRSRCWCRELSFIRLAQRQTSKREKLRGGQQHRGSIVAVFAAPAVATATVIVVVWSRITRRDG